MPIVAALPSGLSLTPIRIIKEPGPNLGHDIDIYDRFVEVFLRPSR
jgi:hypothetical protein